MYTACVPPHAFPSENSFLLPEQIGPWRTHSTFMCLRWDRRHMNVQWVQHVPSSCVQSSVQSASITWWKWVSALESLLH